ncbi:MAG: alpha/beta fold hydrolase [Marmoricola sp.]
MRLHYATRGPLGAPAVYLGGSLGSTHRQWHELVAALSTDYCVVGFDHRGHGASPHAESGVRVEDLASDVIELADSQGHDTFHYVGISLGGAVGQHLALNYPERLSSLTLACTAPAFGDPQTWHDRAASVRSNGIGPLRDATGERWFVDAVRPTARAQAILDDLVATDPESYAACCEALAEYDARPHLAAITTRTLVIGADHDVVSPPEVIAEFAVIKNAKVATINDSRHLGNINQPEAFNALVLGFLEIS